MKKEAACQRPGHRGPRAEDKCQKALSCLSTSFSTCLDGRWQWHLESTPVCTEVTWRDQGKGLGSIPNVVGVMIAETSVCRPWTDGSIVVEDPITAEPNPKDAYFSTLTIRYRNREARSFGSRVHWHVKEADDRHAELCWITYGPWVMDQDFCAGSLQRGARSVVSSVLSSVISRTEYVDRVDGVPVHQLDKRRLKRRPGTFSRF